MTLERKPAVHPEEPSAEGALAAGINDLILELWIATDRGGPHYEEFELTNQQHTILTIIILHPGTTPRALSQALGITKGAVSQHLLKLEDAGYIVRSRSLKDRRVQLLGLGQRGLAYRAAVSEFESFSAERYRTRLSGSDIVEIVTALKKLRNALRE